MKKLYAIVVVGMFFALGAARSMANPTGGQVAAGSAAIAGQGTSTVTINQASNTAIINWQSFSIGTGELTKFVQPSSTSAVLNRVLGGETSLINGTLSANGQIYLVNGNGIVVGPGGVISANAFTASTRDISDADFLSGKLHFTGSGDGSVQNFGKIEALGGDVILIGKTVDNQGTIHAPNGTAGLIAGDDVLLAQKNADGSTITVSPTTMATSASSKIGVHNSGNIAAAAAELKAANGNIYALAIQNEGVVRATTVSHQGGHIWLTSDSGTTVNSGTLDASATVAGGKGGSVILKDMGGTTVHSGQILAKGGSGGAGGNAEISGKVVQYTGTVNLSATGGSTGNLLFDPENVTIQTSGSTTATASGSPTNLYTATSDNTILTVADLQAALANASVTVTTGSSGSQSGDITVANAVTWSDLNTLTLSAFRNVVVNAAITNSSGGSLNLNADNTGTGTGTVSFGGSGSVTFSGGGTVQFFYNPTTFGTATSFASNVTVSGGSTFIPYMLVNNLTNLQAIGSHTTGNFALGKNIDASGSAILNSGAGFAPITTYTGKFNGQGYTIDSLTIKRASTTNIGLFGVTGSGALIENVGLTNVNILGDAFVGALVGQVGINTTVNNTYSTGSVVATTTGSQEIGGLIGYLNGGSTAILNNSYSTATVTGAGTSQAVGGLVGENNAGLVENSHSAGTVSAGSNSFYIGGLVGQNAGATGIVKNSYSTSTVSASSGTQYTGGLVGLNNTGATVQTSYSTGPVSSGASSFYLGGLVGGNVGTIKSSYTSSSVTGGASTQIVGGLVGYNNTGTLQDSYATGTVNGGSGSTDVGGTVGEINGGTVANTYTTSVVSGGTNVGGFTGLYASGTITSDYWDTSDNTIAVTYGHSNVSPAPAGATGETLTQLQTQGTFSGWDFVNTWSINSALNGGTPYLQWQNLVITLTITALDQSTTYTGLVPTTAALNLSDYTITGGNVSDLSSGPTFSITGTNVNAGTTDTIVINATPKSGFAVNLVNGTLTINQAPLTITANSTSKTYGQTVTFAGTEFTPAGLQNSETIGSATISSTGAAATANVAGSPYAINISNATGGTFNPNNYSITYDPGQLTVNTAPLTITANNESKSYGQTFVFDSNNDAGADFSVSGLLNSDAVNSVTLKSNGAAATAGVNNSPYNINVSKAVGSGLNNYTITYVPGQLTVNPALLTITANDESKTYGQTFVFDSNNDAGADFTISGTLYNGDAVNSVSLSSNGAAATAGVNNSPYDIKIKNANGSGLNNYTISYVDGSLTVNPASLTITANDESKTYGQTFVFDSNNDAGADFTVSGTLYNGDVVNSVSLSSNGAAATAGVNNSPYDIKIKNANGSGLNNYTISYVDGSLTVNPASLTITANDESKTYGQTFVFDSNNDAGADFTVTGTLFNGDTVDSVTLKSNGAAATAGVGNSPYNINVSKAVGSGLNNYTISYVDGSLTVNPASLTITANDESKTYGQTFVFDSNNDAGADFTISGTLYNGDTVDSVTLKSNGAAATAGVGNSPYNIEVKDADGSGLHNYDITYVDGSLTVNPASLTITANDESKTYGQTFVFDSNNDAGADFTVTGTLFNGDTVDSVTLKSNGAAATAGVGNSPYNIEVKDADGSGLHNYDITYVDGSLTVNPASLTITAKDESKTYGQTFVFDSNNDAGADFTVTGTLFNGDTVDSVVLSSKGAAPTANVKHSPYDINIKDADGSGLHNYDITYVDGSLTVNPATLTYVADPVTISLGQTIPPLTGTVTGFVNGETLGTATKGTLTFTTTATSSSPMGSYAINGSGLKARHHNYIFVQAPANATALTIGSYPFGQPGNPFFNFSAQFNSNADYNTFFTQNWFPLFDPTLNGWLIPVFSSPNEPHPVYSSHEPGYGGDKNPGNVIAFGSSYRFFGQGGVH